MILGHNAVILILALCVILHTTTGKSIVVRRSADGNDSDNDNDDTIDNESDDGVDDDDDDNDVLGGLIGGLEDNSFAEAMKNISNEIDEYLEKVPEEDKNETIEVGTIDGYDVKTKKTIITGSVGGKDAELHIEQTKVIGKHESEGNDDDDDDDGNDNDEEDEELPDTDA
ncbi:nucleolin-like isoform X2 [Mizuhopecten yessoensis]|uniref:nucleolin-like isoform X2 n=1 Tax=Mizuhopecten yessoensis TaxID=6573 RepID=UPI000B457A04|nr:nucleolin-like isoform X2 [Mizuhopecten yessoensis]